MQDEKQVYAQLAPTHRQRSSQKYKQQFERWVRLRDADWRVAFQRGVAEDAKQTLAQKREEEERSRQVAWQDFKNKVFQEALSGNSK